MPEPSKIERAARAYVEALMVVRQTLAGSDAMPRRKAEALMALELLIAACEDAAVAEP